jgi:hypothetical protein
MVTRSVTLTHVFQVFLKKLCEWSPLGLPSESGRDNADRLALSVLVNLRQESFRHFLNGRMQSDLLDPRVFADAVSAPVAPMFSVRVE